MNNHFFGFIFLICYVLSAKASIFENKERWSPISDPLIMNNRFETRLFMLPLAQLIKRPQYFWSGDYWPLNRGNIHYRWNAKRGFNQSSPSKKQLKEMIQEDIAQLSPAEKFDLLNGRYDYPLRNEVIGISDVRASDWEGICHGWAPASINHKEPNPKVIKNPDGVPIPFGSSDIKAILSYYYAYSYQVPNTHQVGRRCEERNSGNDPNCQQDLNAGAFHIVLANKVGIDQEGLIADMDRYDEVWNHPILGYDSRILKEERPSASAAEGTTRVARIETIVTFASESKNSWNAQNGTSGHVLKHVSFQYVLEMNVYGEIIGGMWRSNERPDFLWIKEKSILFNQKFHRLKELLND